MVFITLWGFSILLHTPTRQPLQPSLIHSHISPAPSSKKHTILFPLRSPPPPNPPTFHPPPSFSLSEVQSESQLCRGKKAPAGSDTGEGFITFIYGLYLTFLDFAPFNPGLYWYFTGLYSGLTWTFLGIQLDCIGFISLIGSGEIWFTVAAVCWWMEFDWFCTVGLFCLKDWAN